MKKEKIIQVSLTAVITVTLAFLWANPSNLAYNVSQQRDILLGRYTVDRMITLLIVTPVLMLTLWSLWVKAKTKTAEQKKIHAFKALSITLAVLPTLVLTDIAMRLLQKQHYVGQVESYHRAPNQVFHGVINDVPEAAFSYPGQIRGYGTVEFTLTVDSQGFRNAIVPKHTDWVVLGDSFAEGSRVSDEQNWPVLLALKRHISTYNLGMSGGNPITYLDTLKKFGLKLEPKKVIYLLYEGNDLRDSNFQKQKLEKPKSLSLFDVIFKKSPLRLASKAGIIKIFAPIGSKRFNDDPAVENPSHPLYPVSWLPIEVPAGSKHFYAFDLKRMLQHFLPEEQFLKSNACIQTFKLLSETKRVCDESGIEFILVFAPDTPHVLAGYITDHVPTEQIYAFLALKEDDLPETNNVSKVLLERSGVQERVVENFCSQHGITFISLTEPVKEAVMQGTQPYYTYDQHWTPDGHKLVAAFLAEKIQ